MQAQRIPPEVLRAPVGPAPGVLPHAWLGARIALLATVLASAVWLAAALSGHGVSGLGRWAAGAGFVLASLAVLGSLGRRLPPQNLGAILLVSWASAVLGLTFAVKSDLLFGRVVYDPGFGPRLLGIVPWQVPFLWLALVLASRETARLLLRPWRRDRHYGYWLIGVAAALVLWTDLSLQPFAIHVAGWWRYDGTIPALNWLGVPWLVFPSGFLLALLVLGFVTPWLIAKRAIPTPPEFLPAGLWLLLNLCFLMGNLRHGLWLAAFAAVVGIGGVVWMAWRVYAAARSPGNGPPRT